MRFIVIILPLLMILWTAGVQSDGDNEDAGKASWATSWNILSSSDNSDSPWSSSSIAKRDTESEKEDHSGMNTDLSSYLQTLTQQGADATTIVKAAVSNFAEIAYPPGENTTLTEAISNVVREVEATHKELDGWQIQHALLNSIKEQASRFLGSSDSTESTAKNFETIINEMKGFETTKNPARGGQSATALIILGVITTVLVFTSLMGLGFCCKHRAAARRQARDLKVDKQCNVQVGEQQQTLLKTNEGVAQGTQSA